jgi:hypothetical protein
LTAITDFPEYFALPVEVDLSVKVETADGHLFKGPNGPQPG